MVKIVFVIGRGSSGEVITTLVGWMRSEWDTGDFP